METVNKTKKQTILIALVIIELVIILGLLVDKFTTMSKTEDIIKELEQTGFERDSISNELKDLYVEYEGLKTSNDTLNNKLSAEQKRIQELVEEIKKAKSYNRSQIEQYKKELETLRGIMRSFVTQIDSLNTRNQELIAENKQVKNKYENIVNKNQELANQKDSLQNQVSVAATLKALNLTAIALNDRGKETNRINKVQKFQVCCTLGENSITRKGKKTVFVRIAKPDGHILMNQTSGMFLNEGKEIAYSSSRDVEYDGKNTDVCVFFNNMQELPEGVFAVDVFVDGKMIGTVSLNLK